MEKKQINNLINLDSEVHWDSSIHDQSQLELVFDYTFRIKDFKDLLTLKQQDENILKEERPFIETQLFLFTPSNLEINEQRYPRERFYSDLRNQIRLHTPTFQSFLKGECPFLDQYIAHCLEINIRLKYLKLAKQEIRFFANYINQKIKFLLKQQKTHRDDRDMLAQNLGEEIHTFRKKYVQFARNNRHLIEEELLQALLWVDEYLSNRYKSFFLEKWAEYSVILNKLFKDEVNYRRQYFKVYDLKHSEQDREHFYQRQGALKKYVSEILFIKFRRIQRQNMIRNMIASLAAALAALFTQLAQREQTMSSGAVNYGFQFYILIGIGVLIYVFKDRLKDLSKEYFQKIIFSRLPDYESYLHYHLWTKTDEDDSKQQRSTKKKKRKKTIFTLGKLKEYIRYLTLEELPEETDFFHRQILRRENSVPIRERILHYRKRFSFNIGSLEELQMNKISLKDIFRLNIHEFLSVFDNPQKDLSLYDPDDGTTIVKTPKTYYFDVILQTRIGIEQKKKNIIKSLWHDFKKKWMRQVQTRSIIHGGQRDWYYEYYRLVLNKEGIVRQEHLGTIEPKNWSSSERLMTIDSLIEQEYSQ